MNNVVHEPVMVQEICNAIPDNSRFIFDGTLGHGGHTKAIADFCLSKGINCKILGVDLDLKMLEKAKLRLSEYENVVCLNDSYKNLSKILQENNIDLLDFVLLDLGVNMEHFKDLNRGFSVRGDVRLDMRFDLNSEFSAYDLVNFGSLERLIEVFVEYADFSLEKSREIAENIVKQRKIEKIGTTNQLRKILGDCGLGEKASIVIFQAIRLEVNNEMGNLKEFLSQITKVLSFGGRCAILTYHSVEDRIVKLAFKKMSEDGLVELVNKKVICPNYKEVQKNRASRSAKLRIIQKI